MTRIPMIVENYSDFDMWRIGAVENGTQRSTHTAAATDACAGGIRLVSSYAMLGKDKDLAELLGERLHNCGDVGCRSVETIRGQIESGKGIGTQSVRMVTE